MANLAPRLGFTDNGNFIPSVECKQLIANEVTGASSSGSVAQRGPFIADALRESLSANGAISVATHGTTLLTSGGGLTMTLANGTVVGQLKRITVVPGATQNTAVITLATAAGGSGQDVITLTPPANNINASCTLLWGQNGWRIVDLVSGTFA
jgi:hypothetical protein